MQYALRYEKCIHHFLYENRHERDNLGGLGVDGRIILNWILKKLGVTMWIGSYSSGEIVQWLFS
jgi:hypothetical protein